VNAETSAFFRGDFANEKINTDDQGTKHACWGERVSLHEKKVEEQGDATYSTQSCHDPASCVIIERHIAGSKRFGKPGVCVR
jgi:hypothetical protein